MRFALVFGALAVVVACRPSDPPHVATIPADVTAVDAGPLSTIAAPPVEEREEAIEEGEELPSGEQAVGKPAPGFTLDHALSKNKKVTLLRNRVTVIHFWATWCAPCKKAFVTLEKLHEHYAERGVSIIGLSVDDELDGVADFARQLQARFLVAWDKGHRIANLYKPQTMPSTYIIDRSGIVRAVMSGYHDGDKNELDDKIKSLL